MDYNNPNPIPVAFVVFDPVTLAQGSGSWGVSSLTATIAAQAFQVLLSSEMGGAPLTTAQVEDLHIVASLKEISFGYTVTPVVGGFVIDFGAALVRRLSIQVSKMVGE